MKPLIRLMVFVGVTLCACFARAECPSPFPEKWDRQQVQDCFADLLKLKSEFANLQAIRTIEIPVGAVLAFDLPDGCPAGWVPFERGASRTIIGASATHLSDVKNVDSEGRKLKAYPYEADGGAENHILVGDEMPPIRLSTNGYSAASNSDRYSAGGQPYPVVTVGAPIQTEPLGKGRGFSLMPPYIALFLCKKSAQ